MVVTAGELYGGMVNGPAGASPVDRKEKVEGVENRALQGPTGVYEATDSPLHVPQSG